MKDSKLPITRRCRTKRARSAPSFVFLLHSVSLWSSATGSKNTRKAAGTKPPAALSRFFFFGGLPAQFNKKRSQANDVTWCHSYNNDVENQKQSAKLKEASSWGGIWPPMSTYQKNKKEYRARLMKTDETAKTTVRIPVDFPNGLRGHCLTASSSQVTLSSNSMTCGNLSKKGQKKTQSKLS